MEFDLLNYCPEAQLELMKTMLQLEQLTALDGHQSPPMAAPVSLPISPMQTHAGYNFSPRPHMSTTTGYPAEPQYTPPAATDVYAATTGSGLGEHHLQDCCYVLSSSPSPGGDHNNNGGGGIAAAAPALHQAGSGSGSGSSSPTSSADAMREAIFHIAALQPVEIDPVAVRPPKRRNVRISKDPQSVAARLRRERISERIRTLQRLVPGGTKMDTASMLDEAIHYVKFLKSQVQSLERAAATATHHRAAALVGGAAASYPGAVSFHAPWQYALPHGDM